MALALRQVALDKVLLRRGVEEEEGGVYSGIEARWEEGSNSMFNKRVME